MIQRTLIVGAIVGLLSVPVVSVGAADRTNVVLIMSDDQGTYTLGCYGNAEARTPVLDRMAAGGMRFTSAFATSPVCSPSRATFFTGRIPSQHGIHDWIKHENIGPRARYCLEHEITLSDCLKDSGYTCGLVGKWHLGDTLRPHAGFSYWYTLPRGGSQYQNADMIWKGEVIKTTGYLTDRITDHAVDFLNIHHERPFYLEVQYNAPHSPWKGHPQDLLDLYADCPFESIPKVPMHPWCSVLFQNIGQREPLTQYFAACSGIDRGVERILAELDRLGLDENTLVIYTSDQGFCVGHHGVWGKGNGTNPRNAFDTSLRIPMIFRHPGKIPAGKTVDAFVGAYDFLPTLLDYLGLPPSTGRNLPGKSFASVLQGKPPTDPPDAVFGEYGHLRFVRTRDHKYIHRANGGPIELYDLREDPAETTNLANRPEYRKLRNTLRARLFEWFDAYVESGSDPVGHEYLHPKDQ